MLLYNFDYLKKKSNLGLVRLQQRPDGLWSILFTCEGTGRTP